MGDFVPEHRLDFLLAHSLQQAGGYRNQRAVLERAGGERIRLAFIERDVRVANARLVGKAMHRAHQPVFVGAFGAIDDVRAGGPFGHRLGHEQGYEGAGEAHHRREGEQGAEIQPVGVDEPVQPEQVDDDRYDQHHRKVGDEEQDNAFHL